MSKQANPLAIGVFVIGALALLTVAIFIFGGNDFFKHKKRFVIFFDSALNGLNIGAPVKLQGVQIGSVKEISLEMDGLSGRIFKPVVIEIEPDLLRDFSQSSSLRNNTQVKQDTQKLIELGLKARLETQSLLTGLLYVDLNFYPEKPANLVNLDYKELPELPSVPTTVDEIKNIADELINKIRKLPLEQMIIDLSDTLNETRNLIKSDDTKKSIAALAKSLQETQKLMITLNMQIGPLVNNMNDTLAETRTTLRDMNKQILPVLKAAEQSLTTATHVLQTSEHTLHAVENMTDPDSPVGQAFIEMQITARSLKDLSDSLERKPNELIFGK